MGMGVGKNYWVHVLKWKSGNLEECIKFINENKPRSQKEWFELRPIPDLKKGTCDYYHCKLVELDN